jgi:hypothetical protein
MATQEETDYVTHCWHDAFNTTATPSDWQMLVWANRHPLVIIEKALQCTGRKNATMQGRGEDFTYMDKVRYASATMRNLQQQAEQMAQEAADYEAAERE